MMQDLGNYVDVLPYNWSEYPHLRVSCFQLMQSVGVASRSKHAPVAVSTSLANFIQPSSLHIFHRVFEILDMLT